MKLCCVIYFSAFRTKRKGIVGAVMATKHVAVPEEGEDKSTANASAISDENSIVLTMNGIAAQTLIGLFLFIRFSKKNHGAQNEKI
jgi:hypothetical protein